MLVTPGVTVSRYVASTLSFAPYFARAVIVACPLPTAVTSPLLLTVATAASPVVQMIAFEVALLGEIVAVSCTVLPMIRLPAVLLSLTLLTGRYTVIFTTAFLPLPSFAVAVIVAVPGLTPFTTPLDVTETILELLVDQVTSCRASAGRIATASDANSPLLSLLGGATNAMLVTPGVTVSRYVASTLSFAPYFARAVIVACPLPTAVTSPLLLTVATAASPVVQMIAFEVALLGEIVAVSCTVLPMIRLPAVLLSLTLLTGRYTVIFTTAFLPLPSFAVAVIVAVPGTTPFTAPVFEMVAIFELLVDHLSAATSVCGRPRTLI